MNYLSEIVNHVLGIGFDRKVCTFYWFFTCHIFRSKYIRRKRIPLVVSFLTVLYMKAFAVFSKQNITQHRSILKPLDIIYVTIIA